MTRNFKSRWLDDAKKKIGKRKRITLTISLSQTYTGNIEIMALRILTKNRRKYKIETFT